DYYDRETATSPLSGRRVCRRIWQMSALGQKQTCAMHQPMSALPPKADMVRVTRLREPQPIIALNRRLRRIRPSPDGRRDRIPIQTLDKSFGIMQISRFKALCESAANRAQ